MNQLNPADMPFGAGAHESAQDDRDQKYLDKELSFAFPFPTTYDTQFPGKVKYQKKVGACTGSLVYYVEYLYWKKTGVWTELSMAFLYKVTKKYVDQNGQEGSSLRSALKAAQKYGVATEATFPSNFDQSHSGLLDQPIPQTAMEEALSFKIGRYGPVPVEPNLIAGAIYKHGMLYARVGIDYHWWTPSWLTKDIDPLERPSLQYSGHAIHLTGYDDQGADTRLRLLNTWSELWNVLGFGTFFYEKYAPHLTECWYATLDPVAPAGSDNSPAIADTVWRALVTWLKKWGAFAAKSAGFNNQ